MASKKKVDRFVDAMMSGEAQNNRKEELPQETAERLNISPDLLEALNRERTKNVGRPRKENARPTQETGTRPGETRATFIVDKLQLRKVKYISLMDTRLLKDVIADALSEYVDKWESENGVIEFK